MSTTKKFFTALVLLAPACAAIAQEVPQDFITAHAILVMRWLHILGAAALLGGGIFVRLVLMPSVSVLSGVEHEKLRAAVRSRWSKLIMVIILVLLVSGFYNYMVVGMTAHKGQGPYHMLMGMKIMLAFGVFFLASLLAGKTSLAQKLQANAGLWLGVTLGMGTLIVMIAGYLRYFPVVH